MVYYSVDTFLFYCLTYCVVTNQFRKKNHENKNQNIKNKEKKIKRKKIQENEKQICILNYYIIFY